MAVFLFGDTHFIHDQITDTGIRVTTIVKKILHGNHPREI
jgi:hypothetical protein